MSLSASDFVAECADQLSKIPFPFDVIVLATVLVLPLVLLFTCLCYCIRFRNLNKKYKDYVRRSKIPEPPDNFVIEDEKIGLKHEVDNSNIKLENLEDKTKNQTSTPFVKKHDNFQQDLIKRVNSVKAENKSRSYDSEVDFNRSRHQSMNSAINSQTTTPIPMPRVRSKGDLTKPKAVKSSDANNNVIKSVEPLSFFVPMTPKKNEVKHSHPVVHSVIRPGAKSALNNSYETEGTPKVKAKALSHSADNTPVHIMNRSEYAEMSLWEQHENRPVLKHTA